jgi:hypothetical protein
VPELPKEDKQRIIEALKARVTEACPRCGNRGFALADGYFNQTIQTGFGSLVVGGPSIPSAVTICDRCGFISQHALDVLGLLPKGDKND